MNSMSPSPPLGWVEWNFMHSPGFLIAMCPNLLFYLSIYTSSADVSLVRNSPTRCECVPGQVWSLDFGCLPTDDDDERGEGKEEKEGSWDCWEKAKVNITNTFINSTQLWFLSFRANCGRVFWGSAEEGQNNIVVDFYPQRKHVRILILIIPGRP